MADASENSGEVRQGPTIAIDPLGLSALMTYILVGGFLVFGFAWAIFPAVEQQNASPCRPLKPDARSGEAPAFEVRDLDGNVVNLSDFAGKFVILNFWATWCEPCITEWPQVHRLAERLSDRDDVVVVAMSIDSDPLLIRPFMQRMAFARKSPAPTAEAPADATPEQALAVQSPQYEILTKVLVLWDPKQEVHKSFGTKQIPDTYFIDEAGQLTQAFINVRPWGTPDAVHCVDSLAGR